LFEYVGVQQGCVATALATEFQHVQVGGAAGPGVKAGARLKVAKLSPEDGRGFLQQVFGILLPSQQRDDIAVQPPLVGQK